MKGDKAHCFTILFSERRTLCPGTEQLEQTCNLSVSEHNGDFLNRPLASHQYLYFSPNAPGFEI